MAEKSLMSPQPSKAEINKALSQMNRPRGKYGAIKTACDHGHTHDSKKEARRCNTLHGLVRIGVVRDLKIQPKYPLHVNGEKICVYIGDFEYWWKGEVWEHVTEDTKGKSTPVYALKRKLMKAILGIDVKHSPDY